MSEPTEEPPSLAKMLRGFRQNPVGATLAWLLLMMFTTILLGDPDLPTPLKLAVVGSWGVLVGGAVVVAHAVWPAVSPSVAWVAGAVAWAWDVLAAAVLSHPVAVGATVLAAGVVLIGAAVWLDSGVTDS